jgi:hypothetical protein
LGCNTRRPALRNVYHAVQAARLKVYAARQCAMNNKELYEAGRHVSLLLATPPKLSDLIMRL